MNVSGWVILFPSLIGLVAICREKRWNWRVVRNNMPLTILFWIGWFTSLIIGVAKVTRMM